MPPRRFPITDQRNLRALVQPRKSRRSTRWPYCTSIVDVLKDQVEMKRKKVLISMRARLVIMNSALKMSNFDEALVCFRVLLPMWQDVPSSESTSQRHLVSQLAGLSSWAPTSR